MFPRISRLFSHVRQTFGLVSGNRCGIASDHHHAIVHTKPRPSTQSRKTTGRDFSVNAVHLLPIRGAKRPGGLALPVPWDPIRVYF
jgi:hypothetical protein